MPAPTQAPRDAAKSRPRYPADSIVSVKIDGILWPAAVSTSISLSHLTRLSRQPDVQIIEDEPEEVSDAEGELSPGCYVIQLIPSHARCVRSQYSSSPDVDR